jgi:hypothetical protein
MSYYDTNNESLKKLEYFFGTFSRRYFNYIFRPNNASKSTSSVAMRKSKTMSFPPNPHLAAKAKAIVTTIKTSTSTKSLKDNSQQQQQRYSFPLHPSKSKLALDLRNGLLSKSISSSSIDKNKNGYKKNPLGKF